MACFQSGSGARDYSNWLQGDIKTSKIRQKAKLMQKGTGQIEYPKRLQLRSRPFYPDPQSWLSGSSTIVTT